MKQPFSTSSLTNLSQHLINPPLSTPPNTQNKHRMLLHTGLRNYGNSGLSKLAHSVMDNRKKQTAVVGWRPVCNQGIQEAGGISRIAMDPIDTDSNVRVDVADGCCTKISPIIKKSSLTIEIGASLINAIKRRGLTQKIEEETKVKITFPKSKKDELLIEGDLDGNITEASEKLQLITNEVIQSPDIDYSHFISLPLAIHRELVDKLVDFQIAAMGNGLSDDETMDTDSYEESSEDSRIDESIFIRPKTFHLTVLMLKLWNKDRLDKAVSVLQSVCPKVIDVLDDEPVYVNLKGLECMKGSLAKARVLYIPVEEQDNEMRLSQACEVIRREFIEAGLVLEKDAKQKLKLHATVMNVRHRKRKKEKKRKEGGSNWFDGREIMKRFGGAEWGRFLIREAHLSHRYAFDKTGYYQCCCSIPFP